ncbi:MAG: zinc-binding dehydrogenase [Acidimicrobiia bacterium]|nr:zinc-binding dehydrogenase [Acidimicrobiia bacterium]
MRALALSDTGVSLRTDYPTPTPRPGEVLVRVLRAGICETDLQLVGGYIGGTTRSRSGRPGFRGVLGHEFVGVAESGVFEGRRVVGEINCSCGECETCRAGHPTHCSSRSVLGILDHDGAFADMIAVPERNLHVVPDEVETDAAVFTEPVAAAFQIPAQLNVTRTDRVVVLGDGRLGNLCAQVLSTLTPYVTVVGKHSHKLALLRSLGIATCPLSELPPERMADIVVDCTGSDTGLPTALGIVRPRGTVVLKTTVAGTQTLALAPIVIDEVTVIGSRCGPFGKALTALQDGSVKVLPLISVRFNLSEGVDALEHARSKPVLKVLLDVTAVP